MWVGWDVGALLCVRRYWCARLCRGVLVEECVEGLFEVFGGLEELLEVVGIEGERGVELFGVEGAGEGLPGSVVAEWVWGLLLRLALGLGGGGRGLCGCGCG